MLTQADFHSNIERHYRFKTADILYTSILFALVAVTISSNLAQTDQWTRLWVASLKLGSPWRAYLQRMPTIRADCNYFWGLAILADSLRFSVNNILAGLWLNGISFVEIALFLLADISLQYRALFHCKG